jgi:putative FmdB family regulatory protein
MPTYEYICEKCGHKFELFQSITAETLKVCPKDHCPKKRWGKGKVKRAIGAGAGIIFKGSGFYETDYRSENYKSAASKDVPPPATSPAPAKPKTDSGKPKPTAV